MAKVKVRDEKQKFEIEYYMDDRLKRNMDEKVIKQLQSKDKDCVLVIDGKEGSGKSTLAMQIGKYVDSTLDISRVVFSPEDFREAILKSKKGQCIIYDEAFTGFSSRSSLSPINRVLVSLSMQMRQKNLFILIVLPTIFLLDKYMAMFRTKALIHVYENKGIRGYFRLYNANKKKNVLLFGSKTMSYSHKMTRTKFKGRFYGKFALGTDEIEADYKEKKEKALADSEKTSMSSAQVRYMQQRDHLLYILRKHTKFTYRKLEGFLLDFGFEITSPQISRICSKFGEYESENDKSEGIGPVVDGETSKSDGDAR